MSEAIKKTKYGLIAPPSLTDNADPTGLTYIDTAGYAHLRVLFQIGATDIATTAAPKLTDCNTSGGTYADITSAALAAAIDAGDDSKIFCIDVDLEGKKRYVKPAITCGDGTLGTNICILGILSTATERIPENATEAGLEELIQV